MERLHKIVNGEKIMLSKSEEKSVREEWEANRIKNEERRKQLQEEKNKLDEQKETGKEKLKVLGLTEEEIEALLSKSL